MNASTRINLSRLVNAFIDAGGFVQEIRFSTRRRESNKNHRR